MRVKLEISTAPSVADNPLITVGLMMAGVQIMLTHGQSDGKPGLSIDDVIYSYYGNRSNSKLENKLNGSMKDKAPVKERLKIQPSSTLHQSLKYNL
jgi:hypothetical protein